MERNAAEKREKKALELVNLKQRYDELMLRYNNGECETKEVVVNLYHRCTERQHCNDCSRCALKDQADALDIQIY